MTQVNHPVQVHDPTPVNGVVLNQESLRVYIRNGIKLGWGNERIAKVVGVPGELIDKERAKLRK